MKMRDVNWRPLAARTIPHAMALLGVAVAWGAEREGVICAAEWGWLGMAILALHLALTFWPTGPYATQGMWWSPSAMHKADTPAWTLRDWGVWTWLEVPKGLRTLGLVALSVALFRPQTASTVENMTREGIDMVLAMDLSGSMLSKDFKPNRLESAKEVAMEFVDSRPFDRIGVVAYEGEAFTSVPITTDHIVVKNGLDQLNTGQLQGGTAIGTGLATAVNRLKGSEAESKVVVLLTDGENNAGQIEPRDAAQLAELNGIRVYTIGVGTIGKAKSPVAILPNGKYKYDWVDVRIDEATLQEVAKATGGRYFRATNEDKLEEIYREIDTLERTQFNVLRYQRKTEASGAWVLLAMVALALEFVLKSTILKSANG